MRGFSDFVLAMPTRVASARHPSSPGQSLQPLPKPGTTRLQLTETFRLRPGPSARTAEVQDASAFFRALAHGIVPLTACRRPSLCTTLECLRGFMLRNSDTAAQRSAGHWPGFPNRARLTANFREVCPRDHPAAVLSRHPQNAHRDEFIRPGARLDSNLGRALDRCPLRYRVLV